MPVEHYKWHVAYTNPKAEKRVFELLGKNRIEAFLPVRKILKQWSDRKKWIEEPLFKSYIFVYISEREYMQVLNLPGVVRFISFGGKAATVREQDIQKIRTILMSESELELSDRQFEIGQKVKIKAGNLAGLEGELVNFKTEKRFLVRIDQFEQSLLLNISPVFLEPVL